MLNEDIGGGKVVEVGAEWIGPTQDRLAALAAELGVETFPTWVKGQSVLERGGTAESLPGHHPPDQPARPGGRGPGPAAPEPHGETGAPGGALGGARCRPARRSDRGHLAAPQRAHPRRAARMLELGIEAVWAAEPADVSLLHVLFYIHSAGSLEMLFDTAGGAQQDRFVGGSQLLPLRAAEALGAERILLGAPVRAIAHGDGRRGGARRRRRGARPARRGGDRAHPGRSDRLRPAAARLPRPAHPAHAARHGDQVHGDLRRAVLARRRPVR